MSIDPGARDTGPRLRPVADPVRPARLTPPDDASRLVAVTARAGWGKTTLLDHHLDVVDARLTVGDADRVAAALATRLLQVLTADEAASPEASATTPDAIATRVAAAWARSDVAAVAVDDAGCLAGSEAVTLLSAIADRLDAGRQLVVCSHVDLGLVDDTHRLAGRRRELDARNLAFDLDAVDALLTAQLTGDRALAARIVDATGGWPAAVQLVIAALGPVDAAQRSARVDAATAPHAPAGRYVDRAVLATLDGAERHLLTALALLGASDAAELAHLTDRDVAEVHRDVEELVRTGLARLDPDRPASVEVTPLMARAVTAALPDDGGALVDDLASRLVDHGEVRRALELLVRHDRPQRLASLLERHGDDLLLAGDLRMLTDAADRLGPEQRTPRLELLDAEALALQGRWPAALACLGRAAHDDGPVPVATARRIGLVHHMRGDLGAALAAYARAVPDPTPGVTPAVDARSDAAVDAGSDTAVDAGSDTAVDAGSDGDTDDHAEGALLLGWRATAHWLRGDVEAARTCATSAYAMARRHDDDRALATAHTALALVAASDGDRQANIDHYRQALIAADRAGDRVQEARIRTNLGSHHLEEGRYTDALAETDRAIDLAERQGYAAVLGIARCNRAETCLRTGALDEAIADAERAREAFERIGSRTEAYALHLLATARAERGELVLARRAYERSLRLAEPSGDLQALAPAYAGLARVLATSDLDAARDAAESAVALDTEQFRADASLARAWVALAAGDVAAAAADARLARDDADAHGNAPAHAEAVTALALTADDPRPGLHDAMTLWQDLDATVWTARIALGLARRATDPAARAQVPGWEQRLAALGAHPDRGTAAHRLVAGSDRTPRATVRLLGSFVVEQHGHPIPASAWGSRKARELLKVLATRGGRSITREQLAHLLWPDEPYDAVSNRLSVALSLVRSQLGSDEAPAITTQGGTIRLQAVEVDVDMFQRLADDGLAAARRGEVHAAVALLLQAEERYGGDLLEDEPDLRWAEDRRTSLRSLYLTVTRTLAGLVGGDDPDLAIRLLLRVLDRDAYDEPAHLDVIIALLRAGRHGEARRHHRRYADRMAELDLPAVPLRELTRSADRPPQRRRAG